MAGEIFAKERAIATLTATGASLTGGSAGVAATNLDCRAAGNAPDDFEARFELTAQWATVTGIAANTVVGDLYLVPLLDGTNGPDVDLTAGASVLPASAYVGSFVATKIPTAATNARFISPIVALSPFLYQAYLLNKSGQTVAVNWTLKLVSTRAQYT